MSHEVVQERGQEDREAEKNREEREKVRETFVLLRSTSCFCTLLY